MPAGPLPVSRDAVPADQRRRILKAAAELIAKRGYQGTSAELIVRRAKVGYSTFYKHFADKEECLFAIFDTALARAEQAVGEAYERTEGTWPEKVAAGLAVLFDHIVAHPQVARVCLVESLTAGPAAVARYEAALRRFDPMLRPGRSCNPRGEGLPDTLEATIGGGVLWIAYQRLIVGEAEKLPGLLPETIEFVLKPYVGEEEAVRIADEIVHAPAAVAS